MSTKEASSAISVSAEVSASKGGVGGSASFGYQGSWGKTEKSQSKTEGSSLFTRVTTSGKCDWYAKENTHIDTPTKASTPAPTKKPASRRLDGTETTKADAQDTPIKDSGKLSGPEQSKSEYVKFFTEQEERKKLLGNNSGMKSPDDLAGARTQRDTLYDNSARGIGSSAALSAADMGPSLEQLKYLAWQTCDTDDYRKWGGMHPVPKSGYTTALIDRIGYFPIDLQKISNALYQHTSGT